MHRGKTYCIAAQRGVSNVEPYVIAPVKCTFHVSLEAEIPSVTVSKFSVLQHGENIIIFCNVTKGQLAVRTVLKRISWFKDGVRKQTVRYPDLGKPDDTLGPMKLTNDRSRDGGNYTCLLEMLLRDIKLHFVSESTLIESECP